MTKPEKEMTKKEKIAMVGKNNVTWWSPERIAFPVCLSVTILSGYARVVLGFMPDITGFMAFIFLLFTVAFGFFLRGGKITETSLTVMKLARDGKTVDVLGKDGQIYALEVDGVKLRRDPTTCAAVSYRVDSPWVELMVGENLYRIWEQ